MTDKLDQKIEGAKKELEYLQHLKESEENSIINRIKKMVIETGCIDHTNHSWRDAEFREQNGCWFGKGVNITLPIPFHTFSLVDRIYQSGMFVTGVTAEDGKLIISVTDEQHIRYKRSKEND